MLHRCGLDPICSISAVCSSKLHHLLSLTHLQLPNHNVPYSSGGVGSFVSRLMGRGCTVQWNWEIKVRTRNSNPPPDWDTSLIPTLSPKTRIHHWLPPANEVWGKVMFLHLCVILFTGGHASQHASQVTWLGSLHPVGLPPGGLPPGGGGLGWPQWDTWDTSGWYASYWNAFLFQNTFSKIWIIHSPSQHTLLLLRIHHWSPHTFSYIYSNNTYWSQHTRSQTVIIHHYSQYSHSTSEWINVSLITPICASDCDNTVLIPTPSPQD